VLYQYLSITFKLFTICNKTCAIFGLLQIFSFWSPSSSTCASPPDFRSSFRISYYYYFSSFSVSSSYFSYFCISPYFSFPFRVSSAYFSTSLYFFYFCVSLYFSSFSVSCFYFSSFSVSPYYYSSFYFSSSVNLQERDKEDPAEETVENLKMYCIQFHFLKINNRRRGMADICEGNVEGVNEVLSPSETVLHVEGHD
jgi:hypothetical protein